MPAKAARVCEWLTEVQAFAEFARASGTIIQAQGHIKPLHWYIACRLVVEGGFLPDDLTPRPPFEAIKTGNHYRLIPRPDLATSTEATVFGGMKSKNIDVVASMRGIGPVLAISCKGTVGAYRNLTNRMEEAIGDCTNIHAAYPALVYGFISLIKANTGPLAAGNDIAIDSSGAVITTIEERINSVRRWDEVPNQSRPEVIHVLRRRLHHVCFVRVVNRRRSCIKVRYAQRIFNVVGQSAQILTAAHVFETFVPQPSIDLDPA